MTLKETVVRAKSSRTIETAVGAHRDAVLTWCERVLRPHLREGEAMPDASLLFELVGRWMTHENAAYLKAASAFESEEADDGEPRGRRDQIEAELRAFFTDLRLAVEGGYKEKGLKVLQLAEPAPRDASALLEYSHGVLKALRDPKAELPAPQRRHQTVDRAAFAAELAPLVETFDVALKDVSREERELKASRLQKDQTRDQRDAHFKGGAQWLSSTLELVGFDKDAARLRPSQRRKGVLAEEETENPTPDEPPTG